MKFFARELLYGLVMIVVCLLLLPLVHVVDWSYLYLSCWQWVKSNTPLQTDTQTRMAVIALFFVAIVPVVVVVAALLLRSKALSETLKIKSIQLACLLSLFFVFEIYLDWRGYAPGSLFRHFRIVEPLRETPNQYADSAGVIRYIKGSPYLPTGYVINEAGFRSKYQFNAQAIAQLKNKGKKIVMVVGDSFVAGLSAEPVTRCFADLLETDSLAVLNFGMLGTDAVQYELICSLYVPLLKPDAVVVCIYENDWLTYQRKPVPGVPIYYRTNSSPNGGMMLVQKPFEFGFEGNDNFASAQEAYNFYVQHYTIRQSKHRWLRFCSYSAVLTQLYVKLWRPQAGNTNRFVTGPINDPAVQQILFGNLQHINTLCAHNNARALFCGIPAAGDSAWLRPLILTRQQEAIVINYPPNFNAPDYNTGRGDIHFNNQGHEKYRTFLQTLLANSLSR